LKKSTTYKDAGVNIDAGNALVEALKPMIQRTRRPEVLTGIGGFASLFSINKLKYEEPVLVSCTDGVGTKLKLAQELNSYQGIGVDLVAMCVNDLLCTGAEPLFFLDYYACGRLDTARALQVLSGITDACAAIQCALVGGETAEMPGVYHADDIDLAGFAVGVVNRSEIIDGSSIALGNKVVGLMSSGIHSNGYSLVRKVVEESGLDLRHTYPRFQRPLGEVLLEPTRIYVNPVLKVKKQIPLLGIAHITGGGLLENLPRVLPPTTRAALNLRAWTRPPIFDLLQEKGNIPEEEMQRVFNCGIGMTVVVAENNAQDLVDRMRGMGFEAEVIGEIIARRRPEEAQILIQ
jgi:phosphoribosylformylglycinamidine cyclo-ligase